jgi:hypothetical protein
MAPPFFFKERGAIPASRNFWKCGKSNEAKTSKAFATESTEVSEVLGPKDKGQMQTSKKSYINLGCCKFFFVVFCSVISVLSVANEVLFLVFQCLN